MQEFRNQSFTINTFKYIITTEMEQKSVFYLIKQTYFEVLFCTHKIPTMRFDWGLPANPNQTWKKGY